MRRPSSIARTTVRSTFSGGKPFARSQASDRLPRSSASRGVDTSCQSREGADMGQMAHAASAPRALHRTGAFPNRRNEMSQIERVRSIYAAFARGDVPSLLDCLAPDVIWEYGSSGHGVPWLEPRRGRAAIAGFFETLA